MEFEVIDKNQMRKAVWILASTVIFVLSILLIVYLTSERYEHSLFRSGFFTVSVLFFFIAIVFFIYYLTRNKSEVRVNDTVVIDEKGFTYSGYQKSVFMAWEDVGLIAVRDERHIPSFHILSKNICKEQSKYFLNSTHIYANTRKTTDNYLYIQYAEGMLYEINKYYKKEIRNEYKLAARGMYEA